jgi:pimeloyl-ACP methyl ester carboxylesterase
VALEAAALAPERVGAVVLVDGGLWSPAALGPRDEVRRDLTPPTLGIPAERLWALMRAGDLGPWWSDEVEHALAPTFRSHADGTVRTRLGLDRHMRVLDGLFDHDPVDALDRCEIAGVPVWAVVCEAAPGASPAPGLPSAWAAVKQASAEDAARRTNCLIHRWPGAVHDVPLQWPALVAGLVDVVVESTEGNDR